MKLSRRLETIVSLIPENRRVIDVGCDHALLDIYLTLHQKNHCIASDINQNVLIKTKEMIERFGLSNKIEVIRSDGLQEISLEPEDVVVIAGMGTSTILHILEEKEPQYMIIDSHNHLQELREKVVLKGYVIKEEKVVFEKNVYYVVIAFEKGKQHYEKQELFLGPILMKEKSPEVIAYFESLLEKRRQLIKNIPESHNHLLKEEITYLQAVLES